jgi:hypothetical protein
MAKRSPFNERYQKQNAHAGSTRKSASSAKPKRSAGTYAAAPEKKSPAKKKQTWSEMVPSTPEIKKWRRIWFVLLLIAVAAFGLAFWGQNIKNDFIATVGFVIELVAVGVAIAIDLVVIRKLRTQAIKDNAAAKKGKPTKAAEKAMSKSDNDKTAGDAGKDPS